MIECRHSTIDVDSNRYTMSNTHALARALPAALLRAAMPTSIEKPVRTRSIRELGGQYPTPAALAKFLKCVQGYLLDIA